MRFIWGEVFASGFGRAQSFGRRSDKACDCLVEFEDLLYSWLIIDLAMFCSSSDKRDWNCILNVIVRNCLEETKHDCTSLCDEAFQSPITVYGTSTYCAHSRLASDIVFVAGYTRELKSCGCHMNLFSNLL